MTDSTILEYSPSEETLEYVKAFARQLQKKHLSTENLSTYHFWQ